MKVDIIGDVHGCLNELTALFLKLGYMNHDGIFIHPDGRVPVFLGDLTDRGPQSIEVIKLVTRMVLDEDCAYYVPGNHCNKLYRYFLGNPVQHKHGLETTVAEYQALPAAIQANIKKAFLELYQSAPLYLVLSGVNAVVAHAGIKESLIGRSGKQVTSFVLYGDVTGEKHANGRPVRRDWAKDYKGDRWIVYGHTPVLSPRQINRTINIDTGCVFGNALSAVSLPEMAVVSVPSEQTFQPDQFLLTD